MKKQLALVLALSVVGIASADVNSINPNAAGMTAQSFANANAAADNNPAASPATNVESQQVQNLVQMNLPAQIQQLQQTVQMLQGMVEIQGHQIQQLQQQLAKSTGASFDQTPVQSTSLPDVPVVPLSGSGGAITNSPSVSPMAGLNASPKISNEQQQKMVTQGQASAAPVASNTDAGSNASNPESNTSAENSLMQTTNNPADQKEQQASQSAYLEVQNKQYSQAIKDMKAYLAKYPAGQYAVNAHYWLGELNLISGNNKDAISEFNKVVNQTQNPAKIPDAMLKLGMIAMSNQDYKTAKKDFTDITKNYANSSQLGWRVSSWSYWLSPATNFSASSFSESLRCCSS